MAGEKRSTDNMASDGLLGPEDPPAVEIINPQGASPFLFVGDHAGNRIPARLGTLGLKQQDRERHIAWDIGVGALGAALAIRLDAIFVRQTYSRLVIDCNRDPDTAEAIPPISDGTHIPGNEGVDQAGRKARLDAIHAPYQDAIAAVVAERASAGRETIFVALHSFTPVMDGVARPWDIGILHNGAEDRFAHRLLAALGQTPGLVVGDNEPYRMDSTDYTVPRHAFPDRPYAELEIAQRRLGNDQEIEYWCALLADAMERQAVSLSPRDHVAPDRQRS